MKKRLQIFQFDRPIAIAVTLFIILLLVFFLVMPEYKTFKSLQIQLGEKTAEYQAEFVYYEAISQTYFDLQARSDDVKKIDDALPTDPDIGKTIYAIQQAGTENGMMIKDLFLSKSAASNTPNSAVGSVKDMTFSIDLLGSYSSLEKFIISLERSSRIFEVTNITFGSSSEASASPSTPTNTNSSISSGPSSPSPSQFQIAQTYSFNMQIKVHSY